MACILYLVLSCLSITQYNEPQEAIYIGVMSSKYPENIVQFAFEHIVVSNRLITVSGSPTVIGVIQIQLKHVFNMLSKTSLGIAAAAAGAVICYCVFFDKKRRSDPDFRQKLKESKCVTLHHVRLNRYVKTLWPYFLNTISYIFYMPMLELCLLCYTSLVSPYGSIIVLK